MNIMVMAGTSDARKIIKTLSNRKEINILATATTSHGADLARSSGADNVREGRFDSEALAGIIKENDVELLIDATHPFASEATRNAIRASDTASVKYIRFERPPTELPNSEFVYQCSSFEDAAFKILQILKQTHNNSDKNGKIFHLAGVNTLHYLTQKIPGEMIVARILPSVYSVKKCLKLGIPHKNIVAMEGTFSQEFNSILMEEYQIGVVLTKESGQSGGTFSKIQAAIDLDISVVVVMRPEIVELQGKLSFDDVKSLCDEVLVE
ncbi:precorrin-6A reductase [Methanobacterium petrolearium]|uniref:precorrin-6A reductase n=1 Tax=Methanobacterium petrolearium TaxID=710190 RepID=UPI001AE5EDBB|nr:precorrin-6A reductase [Methanobacterium petrolearium]MBP1946129.1 precorrin-6A/cobalt-precorrin-6A reductase [Methanobacterium petrolearium]BDZ70730.1 precorrin-6A reductase [Methanobacterium petrolearium]